MSRTTLCVVTATALAVLSLGTMLARYHALGDEVRRPRGPGAWKVTLAIQGVAHGHARLETATPLDLDRQHLREDSYDSDRLTSKPPEARHPERRRVLWTQRPGEPNGPFKARAEFHVGLHTGRGGPGPSNTGPYVAPRPRECLGEEPLIETNHEQISALARQLTASLPGGSALDLAQALFHFVEQKVKNDADLAGPPLSAVRCLEQRGGDRFARCRLLVALLRNRNIPARLVTGVTLAKGTEQQAHCWVEAYIYEHWTPMCPVYRLFGRVPSTYLLFGFGDRPLVRGRKVSDLKFAFLVERVGHDPAPDESALKRTFKSLSLTTLSPADRRLVEILLLLPPAALIICFIRNVIGLGSFGTFAPALIGLAFHDLASLPGILVFVSILLVGWLLRRALDHYHLLQVPRVATMLTLIMTLLIGLIVASHHYGAATTRYISLFPIVILTGMVERFWTLETEDSTAASFRTLVQTLLIALVIAVVLSRPLVVRHLFCYPESLGLVLAGQLLIGRYTGYRLTELFRFRDFLRQPA